MALNPNLILGPQPELDPNIPQLDPNLPKQPSPPPQSDPLLPFLKQVDQSSGGFKKEKIWLNSGALINLTSSGTPKSNHISFTIADRSDLTSRQYGNLFSSFNYPITNAQKIKFTGTTFANGGYSDTAFSGVGNQNKIVVIDIPKNQYGELIDGKSIKLVVPSGGTTISLYSSYFNDPIAILDPDSLFSDPQPQSNEFGQPNQDNPSNVSFLFSNALSARTSNPNSDSTKSWATGNGVLRPFDKGGKFLANFRDDNSASKKKDLILGVCYLDKGFITIHDPVIVQELEKQYGSGGFTKTGTTNATISFKSFTTEFVQHLVLIGDLNEFNVSTNPTAEDVYGVGMINNTNNDPVYITSGGLYNSKNELIGIFKTSEPIPKSKNNVVVLDVKITI